MDSRLSELLSSEQRLHSITATAADAIITADATGAITTWNAAAETMFGYTAADVIGQPLTILMPGDLRDAHRRAITTYDPASPSAVVGNFVQLTGRRADGLDFPLELSVASWVFGGQLHFTGIIRDRSEHAALEEALRAEAASVTLLGAVSAAANRAASFEGAAQACLALVGRSLGWYVAQAYVVSGDGESLASLSSWTFTGSSALEPFLASSRRPWARGVGLPGRVLESGRAAWIADLGADPNFLRAEAAGVAGLRSACAAPVLVGHEVGAVFELFSTDVREPDEHLLEVLTHVGTELGRVLERERAAEALARSENRFRVLTEANTDLLLVVGRKGGIRHASPSFERLLGYDPVGDVSRMMSMIHPDDLPEVRRVVKLAGRQPDSMASLSFRMAHADSTWRNLECVVRNFFDDPSVGGMVFHGRDVSAQRQAEGDLAHERLHDPLTGLANRPMFFVHLERCISRAARAGTNVALIAVDIDAFKQVNNRVGYAGGDAVLIEVSRRVERAVRDHDTLARTEPVVARPGGDGFLVLCEGIDAPADAALIAARLLAEIRDREFEVGDVFLKVRASAGVAFEAAEGATAAHLVADAEEAVRRAKESGGNAFEFMDGALRAELERRTTLADELAEAIRSGGLALHYQPKVELLSGALVGFEALVRWPHPQRGMISPVEFIPLAEETGLIRPLGLWVLHEACRQSVAWQIQARDRLLVMSVNVSGREFSPALAATVHGVIVETGIDPASLCLEITESVVMDDADTAIDTFRDLKALGVGISIDDFGTGYSSLAYLKRFPVDELKVDRSFVDGLGRDAEDTAIVAAIVAMAHALHLTVVAEGVETEIQLNQLQILGCEIAQGYLFSRPRPAADLTDVLEQGTISPQSADRSTTVDVPTAAPTILLVDDNAEIRRMAAVGLSAAGFDVVHASSGAEALAAVRLRMPDCVLVDITMPEMSGIEVCRALRADPAAVGCTVVLLTAHGAAADKVEGFSAGADDYIVKPFSPRELTARVRSAMHRRAAAMDGRDA